MAKLRRIEWHAKTLKICQIPKDGLEYALVSEDYRQIHQLVWCKDFLQDAIFGHINKQRVAIYGFQYDPMNDPPVYMDQTRLVVTNWKDRKFEEKLLTNCQDFLHQIETMLKLKKTTIEPCADPPARYKKCGVFLLNGSKRWMSAPPMISLYTLLIRLGFVHPVGQSAIDTMIQIKDGKIAPYNHHPHKDTDANLLRSVYCGIERILQHGDRSIFHGKLVQNYPQKSKSGLSFSVHQIHENCGMIGYTTGTNITDFPHWYRNN